MLACICSQAEMGRVVGPTTPLGWQKGVPLEMMALSGRVVDHVDQAVGMDTEKAGEEERGNGGRVEEEEEEEGTVAEAG